MNILFLCSEGHTGKLKERKHLLQMFTVLATRLVLMKDHRPEGSSHPLWKQLSTRHQWEFPNIPLDWTLLDIHEASFSYGLLDDVEFIDLT